jgi:hypothetical protein
MQTALQQKSARPQAVGTNLHDHFVVAALVATPLRQLLVDKFADQLCEEGSDASDEDVSRLRAGLIGVYFSAAQVRWQAKARTVELTAARRALDALTEAVAKLDDVNVPMRRGLSGVLSPLVIDVKGRQELNAFQSACHCIRFSVISPMLELWKLVEAETAKTAPAKSGERKKRLRTLVEALAQWWIAATGKTVAPCVRAKRLDHRPALVMGRDGPFLSLAVALFSKIDQLNESEVVSAVTNVHEDFLARQKSAATTAQ